MCNGAGACGELELAGSWSRRGAGTCGADPGPVMDWGNPEDKRRTPRSKVIRSLKMAMTEYSIRWEPLLCLGPRVTAEATGP